MPFLVALAACGGAAAQTAPAVLDPVVVTATRVPVPLSQTLSDVTVISRDDIERQGGTGAVGDLLARVAGFQMTRNGGPGSTTSLYIRGGETRFTAVLIDGMRVDSQSTGGASWEVIPLSQIDRIEIVRGPASAVYGSDAVGGVVQIFTRRGEKGLQADVGVGAGNFGTAKGDASLLGATGLFDYALTVAGERSNGYNAITNPAKFGYNPDRDGYRARSFSGRFGARLNDAHRIDFTTLRGHIDAQYDNSASTDDHSLHDLDVSRLAWTAQWAPMWRSLLAAGQSKDLYQTRPSIYRTETRLRNYAWQNDFTFGAHSIDATLERREDQLLNTDLIQTVTPGAGDRSQNSVSLGYALRDRGYSLQANVRQDHDSEFGNHHTGSIAGGIDLADNWRVQASAGTAFRAPTLYQRFSPYGSSTVLLKPESSRNIEAALKYHAGRSEASITLYRNLVSDLITFGAPGICASTFGCYRNTAKARLQGATLQAKSEIAGLRLSGSLDMMAPRDEQTGKQLARRAREFGTVSADTDIGNWTVGGQVQAAGRRYDDAANKVGMGAYALVHADAQFRFNAEWRLQLRIDNLFDHKYESINGYAAVPRTAFLGLRWTPAIR